MNPIKIISGLFILALMALSTSSAEDRTMYFILDSSGSMWGRVEGGMKADVARGVMKKLLSEMPPDVSVGLSAYGHRRKADCSDIEEIVPVGPEGSASAIVKIDALRPNGKTPLSDAVVKAAESLKGVPGEKTIVLVSDGIETCDKDPCAVVKELKASGAQFVLHVIGFDVKDDAIRELSCMAEAGGGSYFLAKNAEGLTKALQAVKEAVVEKKPVPTAAPTSTPLQQQLSQGSTSVKVKVLGPGAIVLKLPPWLKAPYYWKVVNPETGEEKARFNTIEKVSIAAGVYQVAWKQTEHASMEMLLGEVFSVEPGKDTEVVLQTSVRLVTPAWVKAPYYWALRIPGDTKDVARFKGDLENQLVMPGTYDLVWRQTEHASEDVVLKSVVLAPDVLNEVPLATAIHLVAASWVKSNPYFWELRDGANAYRFSGDFNPQLVPPGKYDVIIRFREHSSTDSPVGNVDVKESQATEFPVNTGVQFNVPKDKKPPYQVKFIPVDDSSRPAVTVKGEWLPMPLHPGKYKITYQETEHGSSEVTIIEDLQVEPGILSEIDL